MNYLEAVQEAGTDNADDVVAKLEGKKINDVFLRNGEVRAADHAVTHDVYLAKVKETAGEEWDYEEIVKTIPAAEAYGEPNAACKIS
jgi:branched-chain amino acid transport system substrate-binding protein